MKLVSPLLGAAFLMTFATACDRNPAAIPPQPSADAPADPGNAVAVAQEEQPRQRAQDRQAGPEGRANFQQRAEERLQRMTTELGLNDDQTQKVRAIFEQQSASLQQQMGDDSGSREERRAAFQQARAAANAEIEKILTPDQMTKWSALQQEWDQRRMERNQGGN